MRPIGKNELARSNIFVSMPGGNIAVQSRFWDKPLIVGFLPGVHEGKKLLAALPPDATVEPQEGVEIITPDARVAMPRHTQASQTAANPNPVYLSPMERDVKRMREAMEGMARQLSASERREKARTAAAKKAKKADDQPADKDPDLVEKDDPAKQPDKPPAKKPEKADEQTE